MLLTSLTSVSCNSLDCVCRHVHRLQIDFDLPTCLYWITERRLGYRNLQDGPLPDACSHKAFFDIVRQL